eukprot:scaffold622501_cov45-Prasinocladus_malaysianus.AAC.1
MAGLRSALRSARWLALAGLAVFSLNMFVFVDLPAEHQLADRQQSALISQQTNEAHREDDNPDDVSEQVDLAASGDPQDADLELDEGENGLDAAAAVEVSLDAEGSDQNQQTHSLQAGAGERRRPGRDQTKFAFDRDEEPDESEIQGNCFLKYQQSSELIHRSICWPGKEYI